MTHDTIRPRSVTPQNRPLGFSLPTLIGLALLGLPRVILHDLHMIEPQGPTTWLLALGPVAIWIALALAKKVPNPFLTVLMIGTIFGVMLVTTHQVLWDVAFQGHPPAVGGSAAATLIPRLAAIPSGLFTGAILGAIGGLIAWAIQRLTQRSPA